MIAHICIYIQKLLQVPMMVEIGIRYSQIAVHPCERFKRLGQEAGVGGNCEQRVSVPQEQVRGGAYNLREGCIAALLQVAVETIVVIILSSFFNCYVYKN